MGRRIWVFFSLLLLASSSFADDPPITARSSDVREPTWTLSGTWTRSVFFYGDLYRVNLHFGDLDQKLREYVMSAPAVKCEGDAISAYLLDPAHQTPVKMIYDVLSSQNSYWREEERLIGSLNQIGYQFVSVDDDDKIERWQLKTKCEDQDDINAYVDSVIGRDKKNPAIPHKYRGDGDTITIRIGPHTRGGYEATLSYLPSRGNRSARKAMGGTGSVDVSTTQTFRAPTVLLGIISTFSSNQFAKPEFRDKVLSARELSRLKLPRVFTKEELPGSVMTGAVKRCLEIQKTNQ